MVIPYRLLESTAPFGVQCSRSPFPPWDKDILLRFLSLLQGERYATHRKGHLAPPALSPAALLLGLTQLTPTKLRSLSGPQFPHLAAGGLAVPSPLSSAGPWPGAGTHSPVACLPSCKGRLGPVRAASAIPVHWPRLIQVSHSQKPLCSPWGPLTALSLLPISWAEPLICG